MKQRFILMLYVVWVSFISVSLHAAADQKKPKGIDLAINLALLEKIKKFDESESPRELNKLFRSKTEKKLPRIKLKNPDEKPQLLTKNSSCPFLSPRPGEEE